MKSLLFNRMLLTACRAPEYFLAAMSTLLLQSCYISAGDGNVAVGIGIGPPPEVQVQPQNIVVSAGQPATFSVSVISTSSVAFEWRRNALPIAGANDGAYTLVAAQPSDDGARFSVEIFNAYGSTVSAEATLTVLSVR